MPYGYAGMIYPMDSFRMPPAFRRVLEVAILSEAN